MGIHNLFSGMISVWRQDANWLWKYETQKQYEQADPRIYIPRRDNTLECLIHGYPSFQILDDLPRNPVHLDFFSW